MPSVFEVIGTALLLGIVHVLTGPDHLSALSTLSVGKPLKVAFGLGVRWGCGHSFGLLIVAIIFFAVGRQINLKLLSYWADMFVGIFMIVLGGWYSYKAMKERKKYLQIKEDQDIKNLLQQSTHPSIDIHNQNKNIIGGMDMNIIDLKMHIEPTNNSDNNNRNNNNNHNDDDDDDDDEQIELAHVPNKDQDDNNNNNNNINDPPQKDSNSSNDDDDDGSDDDESDNQSNISKSNSEQHQLTYQNGKVEHIDNDPIPDDDIIIDGNMDGNMVNKLFNKEETSKTKCLTRLAAFVAGIFHGIAGPGGVLGVMVALRLNDWFLSSLYLLLFFLSSIVTMGVYAIVYGYTTARITICANNKQQCAFVLKIISAIFSLIIGILWLSLTFAGTLDDWFGD